MPASYRFVVAGRVQGVFFRQSAAVRARALDIAGWVRNRDDGRVEGVASGTPRALEQFRAWLGRGPPAARVSEVQWIEDAAPAEKEFVVRR